MSSPFMAPYNGFSDQVGGSSPGRAHEGSSYSQTTQDLDIRPMKCTQQHLPDEQILTDGDLLSESIIHIRRSE